MKKSIFILVFVALIITGSKECFSWGEELSPYKIIYLDSGMTIFEHYLSSSEIIVTNYHNNFNVKYLSADSSLICAAIPLDKSVKTCTLFKYKLNSNEKEITMLPGRTNFTSGQIPFILSDDGKYYFSNDKYYLIESATGARSTNQITDGSNLVNTLILKSNSVIVSRFTTCIVYPNSPEVGEYYLTKYDSTGKQTGTVLFRSGDWDLNAKHAYFMKQSPDGKYFAALFSAPFTSKDFFDGGVSSEYKYCPGIIRLFSADNLNEHYDLYPEILKSKTISPDSAKMYTVNNIPFRFNQSGNKLYMQNLYNEELYIPGPRDWSNYCLVADMDEIENSGKIVIDTVYVGYPLRNLFWCNGDKNILLFDDNSNDVSILDASDFTEINRVTLRSSDGRRLKNWQVYPDADLIIGCSGTTNGNTEETIEIFKISGISAVSENNSQTSVLFPNPADKFAVLNLNLAAQNDITLDISDLSGKLISTSNRGIIPAGITPLEINTSALSSGSYFVTARGNNFSKTFKLIIKK